MTLAMIADGERIVSDYLRSHADVDALGTRIVGKTPSSLSASWVRVTQLDASNAPNSIPEHLISYLLQIDCYASASGGQREANLLGRTVRGALQEMPGVHDGITVSAVITTNDHRTQDTDLEPARDCRILTVEVYLHQ